MVVPAYNEAAVIGAVVSALRDEFPHVVVIDDGSSDDTAAQALAGGATVLRHPLNRGQGAALQTGIDFSLAAGARWIVTFDSDGQHQVGDLARLLAPVVEGPFEVAFGSRFLGNRSGAGIPPGRRLLLRAGVFFTRLTSGSRLTDTHNGLRAFTRRAARSLSITLDRMAHASEIIDQVCRSRLPYTEVPVTVLYSDYSRRKGQRSWDAVRVAFDFLIGRRLQ